MTILIIYIFLLFFWVCIFFPDSHHNEQKEHMSPSEIQQMDANIREANNILKLKNKQ